MPFVSIEGIDGSGKTTQVDLLARAIENEGWNVIRTKEPNGGQLGQAVRAILATDRPTPLAPLEEMLLISAARYDHVRSIIRPALLKGSWVVCDRFVDSTFAFQVYGSEIANGTFEVVTAEVVGETIPDFTFILDISPELAAVRRESRGDVSSADPAEAARNFEQIRQGLLQAAQLAPGRCHVIDASRAAAEIAAAIWAILRGCFDANQISATLD